MVRQYVPIEGHWDEALRESGFPRRHWRQLSVALGRMGFRQLSGRWRTGPSKAKPIKTQDPAPRPLLPL